MTIKLPAQRILQTLIVTFSLFMTSCASTGIWGTKRSPSAVVKSSYGGDYLDIRMEELPQNLLSRSRFEKGYVVYRCNVEDEEADHCKKITEMVTHEELKAKLRDFNTMAAVGAVGTVAGVLLIALTGGAATPVFLGMVGISSSTVSGMFTAAGAGEGSHLRKLLSNKDLLVVKDLDAYEKAFFRITRSIISKRK